MSRTKTNASPGGSPGPHTASPAKVLNLRKDSASHTYSNFAAQLDAEGGSYTPTLYSSRSAVDVSYNTRSGPPPLLQEGAYEHQRRAGSARSRVGGGANFQHGSSPSPTRHGRPAQSIAVGEHKSAPSITTTGQNAFVSSPAQAVDA